MTEAELRAEIAASVVAVEQTLRLALRRAVRHVRDVRTLEEMALLIAEGRADVALAVAEADESARYWVVPVLAAGLARGGAVESAYLGARTGRLIRFDPRGFGALAAANAQAARTVQGLVSEQEFASRDALLAAMSRSAPPVEQAAAVRRAFGLSRQQVAWLTAYERSLRSQDPPPSPRRLASQLDAYAERLLATRLDGFALSGAQASVHSGAEEAALQAQYTPFLQGERVVQIWHTMGDHLVRNTHVPMHGQRRDLGEAFTSGGGASLRYPHDPDASAAETRGCRCSVSTELA